MSFRKLVFTKDWNDPLDFPTIETSEAQVRADIQQLHDEARDAINDLIDELGGEGGEGSAAEQLSATPRFTGDSNTIQGQLDSTQDAVDVLSPQVSANTSARHTHSNKSVLDGITSALITAWNNAVTWVTTNGSNVLSHLSDTVKHITSTERSTWNAKQNAISDLATIRSGAALGATAVQPAELNDYVEEPATEGTEGQVLATDGDGLRYWRDAGGKYAAQAEAPEDTDILWIDTDEDPEEVGDYSLLANKPKLNGVELAGNKNLAAFGIQPEIADLSDIRGGAEAGATALQPGALSGYATESYVNNHHDSSKQEAISDLDTIRSGAGLGATALQPSALSPYRPAVEQDEIDESRSIGYNPRGPKSCSIYGEFKVSTNYFAQSFCVGEDSFYFFLCDADDNSKCVRVNKTTGASTTVDLAEISHHNDATYDGDDGIIVTATCISGDSTVNIYDAETLEHLETVDVGITAVRCAYNYDKKELYVANANTVKVFTVSGTELTFVRQFSYSTPYTAQSMCYYAGHLWIASYITPSPYYSVPSTYDYGGIIKVFDLNGTCVYQHTLERDKGELEGIDYYNGRMLLYYQREAVGSGYFVHSIYNFSVYEEADAYNPDDFSTSALRYQKNGTTDTTVIYADSSYAGFYVDGSEDKPFVNIQSAIRHYNNTNPMELTIECAGVFGNVHISGGNITIIGGTFNSILITGRESFLSLRNATVHPTYLSPLDGKAITCYGNVELRGCTVTGIASMTPIFVSNGKLVFNTTASNITSVTNYCIDAKYSQLYIGVVNTYSSVSAALYVDHCIGFSSSVISIVKNGSDNFANGAAAPSGSTRENLLINPWFSVNQREVESFTQDEYGVDRWKLVSGTATVNTDGTITLNGTLRQILENALGRNDFFASVMCKSGSATATYNDTTKYFDIVSADGVIRCAKLEIGSDSTLQNDVAPDYGAELLRCQAYFYRCHVKAGTYSQIGTGCFYEARTLRMPFYLPCCMIAEPTVSVHNGGSIGILAASKGGASKYSSWVGKAGVLCGNVLTLSFTLTEDFSVGEIAGIRGSSADIWIDVSAEL